MEDLHCASCGHTIEIKVADIEDTPKQYTGECERCDAVTVLIAQRQKERQSPHSCEKCGSANVEVIYAGDKVYTIICKDCTNNE